MNAPLFPHQPCVLDACCGGRMFWFDKRHPAAVYMDNRTMPAEKLTNGATFEVKPDVVADFTAMPFADNSFYLVVFDPPHLTNAGKKGWQAKKYGRLTGNWRDDLRKGFSECLRVLKPNGTLIFKWNEHNVKVSEILPLCPVKPLFGHASGRQSKTHWITFLKGALN